MSERFRQWQNLDIKRDMAPKRHFLKISFLGLDSLNIKISPLKKNAPEYVKFLPIFVY